MKRTNGTISSLNVINSLAAVTENANRSLDTTENSSEAIKKIRKIVGREHKKIK